MTWDYIFMLALGAYAFKSGGLIILNKFNLDKDSSLLEIKNIIVNER